MKKLLVVIFLGLLLNGCTGAGGNLPNIGNAGDAGKIIDMSNSTWKDTRGNYFGMMIGTLTYTYNFFDGGKCSYSYWDLFYFTDFDCEWSQNGNKVKLAKYFRDNEYRLCVEGIISGIIISWRDSGGNKCKRRYDISSNVSWKSKAINVTRYLDDSSDEDYKP